MTFTGSQGNRGLIYTISISEGPLNQMDTRRTCHACDLREGREEEEEGNKRRGRDRYVLMVFQEAYIMCCCARIVIQLILNTHTTNTNFPFIHYTCT